MRSNSLHEASGMTRPANSNSVTEAIAAQEREDDGLVHGHAWANALPMPARPAGASAPYVPHPSDVPDMRRDGYDDGLVHNHAWAASDR